MVARLIRNVGGNSRQALPGGPIMRRLSELDIADAGAVLIAPVEPSHRLQQLSEAHPIGHEFDRLCDSLTSVTAEKNPRTARLLGSSRRKAAQKVIEEAGEVALEAVKYSRSGVVRESADLLYHLAVLWRRAKIDPTEIWAEMRQRADSFGIAEKLPKSARQA
jgi:phosphoribosyl-ATP pyrophosphohydrolase